MLALCAIASISALLTGNRVSLSKGSYPAHPLLLKQTVASLAAGKRNGLTCSDAEAAEVQAQSAEKLLPAAALPLLCYS